MANAGFKWNGFMKAVNTTAVSGYTVIKGNILLELVLPNALKLNSSTKLRDRLDNYIKSHGYNYPEQITVNKRQYQEYLNLFGKAPTAGGNKTPPVPSFEGIKLVIKHG